MTASGDGAYSPWRRRAVLAGWGLLVFAVAWVSGRRTAEGPGAVTRVYDVRDLLVEVPDFDNAPQLGFKGGGGAKTATRPAAATQRTVDDRAGDLAALVRRSIDPDTWDQRPRAVTPLAGQLVVTQTPEVHGRVAEFLRQMREARQVTVTIAAKLITVDESILRRLPSPMRERLLAEPPADAGGPATTPTTGPTSASSEDVVAMMDAVRSGRGAGTSVLTAPQVTLFSGQRAYVIVSNQRPYVADFTATSRPAGQWTVTPNVETVEAGALFDVRAAASADRTSITLDLRQQVSNVLAMDSTTATATPTGMTIAVQRPNVDVRTLRTAVTIPEGRTAIVSAYSSESTSGKTRTFLLVTPRIAAPPASANDRVFPKPR